MGTSQRPYTYPPRLPLLKFFLNAESIRKNPLPFHHSFFVTYGDTFSVRLGRKKHILLSRDKEVVQHILQKNHKNYYKSTIQTKFLSRYLGNGLLTANGDFWLQQRRLIQPAFHKQKMEQLVGLMLTTIKKELASIPSETSVSVFPLMNQVAFKVVANSLFHLSASEATQKRLQYIFQEVQQFLVKEVRLPHKGWWFNLSGQIKKHKKLSEESRAIIRSIIEKRRQSSETHDDLLAMLLATRYEDTGEPMSTKQLIDEIAILFVAGHETTANALSFTTFLLAKHPEIYDRVRTEVLQVASSTDDLLEQISAMEYTRAVIDESMRLYPPAWITDRDNLEDDELGPYHIRKGTLVGISFYELHRHPDYWEEPERFDPERFLGANKKKTTGVYYPFGAGPRMCIGMGFAIYEMVLTVAELVKQYRFETSQNEVELNPLITLKPKGLKVIFTKHS